MIIFIGSIPIESTLMESCAPVTYNGAATLWITFRDDSNGKKRPPQAIRFDSLEQRDAALESMREQVIGNNEAKGNIDEFNPETWLKKLDAPERDKMLSTMGYVPKRAVPMPDLIAEMPKNKRDPMLADLGYTPIQETQDPVQGAIKNLSSLTEKERDSVLGDFGYDRSESNQTQAVGDLPNGTKPGRGDSRKSSQPGSVPTNEPGSKPIFSDEGNDPASEQNPDQEPDPDAVEAISQDIPNVFTVCFCGTSCTRDEGEKTRQSGEPIFSSDKEIYSKDTGYIPVRIHKEISGDIKKENPSVTIRGVGQNDWLEQIEESSPLIFDGPLNAPGELRQYAQMRSGQNERKRLTTLGGWTAAPLALHAANLAARSNMKQFNFIGHSRGAVESIMAAWFLYAYGSPEVKNIPVNIFAIDPVPGTGNWYGILTQLPPNVANYVGVYAWDHCGQLADKPFMALVPRPNEQMTGHKNDIDIDLSLSWKNIADNHQLADPLEPSGNNENKPQPERYELYACRGRHGTVAGIKTKDGYYDPKNIREWNGLNSVEPVPQLVYKMARAYLTKWGTTFNEPSGVDESAWSLRRKIHQDPAHFDTMGGGVTRTSKMSLRPYVRRISSISGRNPANSYYMDNVVGDPPYRLAFPVTSERERTGWVKWKFL